MSTEKFKVGDVLDDDQVIDLLPTKTVIVTEHPRYKHPIPAVRVENAFGEKFWEAVTFSGIVKTENIRGAVKYAPFVILQLPHESNPNLEAEIQHDGY